MGGLHVKWLKKVCGEMMVEANRCWLPPPPHSPESFVEKKRFTEPCAELGNLAVAEELGVEAEQKREQTRNGEPSG